MEFPLNQMQLNKTYVSTIEDKYTKNIITRFSVFKKYSSIIVIAFKNDRSKYKSIHNMPVELLKKYRNSLGSLLGLYSSLEEDLKAQSNYYKKLFEDNNLNNRICERIYSKIKYTRSIRLLYEAIKSIIKKENNEVQVKQN